VRICPRCSSVYAAHVARCGLDNELLVEGPQDPLVGKTLDRYLIVERLGAGGMGCVYRATHTIIDREYAIKVLYGDFACDDKFRARFQREAQSVSKIRHPNVVTVEDFGTTSTGLTFLAMEMVRGRTLEEVIEKEAPISPARTAHIVRQVASGLGAAHQLGFVHRDVKPANVMLTRVDGVEWVKILDFGAVNLRAVPLDQRLTSIGHIIGTPTYMAPEQTQDPNVEATADLYAMGVMMHEMLTGQPPFTGQGRAEVLVKHITEAPPPTPPSRGLEVLTQKLLRKLPADRPQSADDVIAAIDRLNLGLAPVPVLAAKGTKPLLVPPPSVSSAATQPVETVRRSNPPAPQSGDEDITRFDTFPSLGVADPAEPQAWNDWNAEASLEAAPSYADVASQDGPPHYPSLNLKYPSSERSEPVAIEPQPIDPSGASYLRDTTDPRFAPPTESGEQPAPSEATDVGVGALPTRAEVTRGKSPSTDDENLLYEPRMEGEPRPSPPDDGGPTQVDFRMDLAELGLERPVLGDDTVPMPKTLLPAASTPELRSFSDEPIPPPNRLAAPLQPKLSDESEMVAFDSSRTVLDPALVESSGNFTVRPVVDEEERAARATIRDTMVPDTKIPDLLTLPPLSAVDQGYVALKTPPPLVVRDELGPVPDPVRPGWGRLALLAALIFALVVAIGLLGTAYLRRPIDVSPEAAAHEDSARR
jgi:serine/threonine protein kinase